MGGRRRRAARQAQKACAVGLTALLVDLSGKPHEKFGTVCVRCGSGGRS